MPMMKLVIPLAALVLLALELTADDEERLRAH